MAAAETTWVLEQHDSHYMSDNPMFTVYLVSEDGSLQESQVRAVVLAQGNDGMTISKSKSKSKSKSEGVGEGCRAVISSMCHSPVEQFVTRSLSVHPGASNVITVESKSSPWSDEHLLTLAKNQLETNRAPFAIMILERLAKKANDREVLGLLRDAYLVDENSEAATAIQGRLDELT